MSQSRSGGSGVVLASVCLLFIIITSGSAAPDRKSPGMANQVNQQAAAAAFANAGKQPGLQIWRVENFSPVAVKSGDFGKLHTGDSYIVLSTKDGRGKKSWDIFYWLGSETSQDESGAAAILAVALDDQLGGAPIQHRETQEHESQQFLSNFPSGVRYLPGGVKSGFQHVDTNAPGSSKLLYQVKGKRNIRIKLIEPKASAMNKGDSFILDAGKTIYVYNGANSQKGERLIATQAAKKIRDQDHNGRSTVQTIDETSSPEEVAEFFNVLGGGSRSVLRDASSGGDDQEFERNYDAQFVLYKISDATGSLKVEKIGQKPISKSSLNTNDAFILDTVTSGIYSWIGRKSTKAEKEQAMVKAQEFLKTQGHPAWTPITRVVEGGEPSTFKNYFSDWTRDRRSVDDASDGSD